MLSYILGYNLLSFSSVSLFQTEIEVFINDWNEYTDFKMDINE